MSQTYKTRRKAKSPVRGLEAAQTSGRMIGNQSMEALMTGEQTPSSVNLGRPVDLPGAIQEKMESAFGADLSGVRLYESQAVADAGAQAITMGNKIGFAPGQLDLTSSGGQSLLGHELSHVVSQARGEVSGNGFLNDHALEARADREGAMAAAGENVYSGPVTPLSSSSVSSAVGPMQAKKKKEEPQVGFKPNLYAPASPASPAPTMEEVNRDDAMARAKKALWYSGAGRQQEKFSNELAEASNGKSKKDKAKMYKNLEADPVLKAHLIASLPYADGGGSSANNAKFRNQLFEAFSGDNDKAKTAMLAQQVKVLKKALAVKGEGSQFASLSGLNSSSDRAAMGNLTHNDDLLNLMSSMSTILNATGEDDQLRYSNEQLGFKNQEERDALLASMNGHLDSAKEARLFAQKLMGQETGDNRSLEEMRQDRHKRDVDQHFQAAGANAAQHYSKDQLVQAGPGDAQTKELNEMLNYDDTVDAIKGIFTIRRKMGQTDEEILANLPDGYAEFMKKHNIPIPPK